MTPPQILDATELLRRIAARVPLDLRTNVVIIGSIATAWSFRDMSGTATVATKDIDLLLRPAVDAIATAETLAKQLFEMDWQPVYPNDRKPGTLDTPEEELPALRLSPPEERDGWFVELLGEPQAGQTARRAWRRFDTPLGAFALPCFRYMPVAIDGAAATEYGIRTAQPARMALAHMLEHADPDTTPISGLSGNPARFLKDVGRAIALWWLASEQSSVADEAWLAQWRDTLATLYPNSQAEMKAAARSGLSSVGDYLPSAHAIALNSVLAPHGTTLDAYRRAHASLLKLIDQL